jgi:quercetin dioxygenase-like cupin family protein
MPIDTSDYLSRSHADAMSRRTVLNHLAGASALVTLAAGGSVTPTLASSQVSPARAVSSGASSNVATTLGTATPQAPPSGITRTDLQQHDLGAQGWEVIQVRVDFAPGAMAPGHRHPGEEIVYVIDGVLEYQVAGELPVTITAGEVLFIPAETIHAVKNTGSGNAAELATYVVEKGKPLVVLAN